MADVILAERFVDDLSYVYSSRVLGNIYTAVDSIGTFPQMGSTDIPQSIRAEFGPAIRKVVTPPFDIFYEYDAESDTVTIMTLVHFRAAE